MNQTEANELVLEAARCFLKAVEWHGKEGAEFQKKLTKAIVKVEPRVNKMRRKLDELRAGIEFMKKEKAKMPDWMREAMQ